MLRTIIKSVIALFVAYVSLLYWGDGRYREEGLASLEVNAFHTTIYVTGLLTTVCLDLWKKYSSPGHYYLTLAIYGCIGFLIPTVEGKALGAILTIMLIMVLFRAIWTVDKIKE